MPARDERETQTGTRAPIEPSAASPGPAPGDLVAGAYRIERVLGRGGMGVVFEATDVRLDRTVALKLLAPGSVATPEQRARFEREARALARLDGNEHVARVLWFGEMEGGAALLVMEHLIGRDLRHELRNHGPLSQADAVLFTLHVCDALADAHAAGIIHRDLKPSNLFLTRDRDNAPRLKVLDFGVTKSSARRDGEMATASHAFMGSLPFVSPEQLKSTKDADARSDVWSLGVTLYEMLTGRLPFEGKSSADIAVAIENHRPLPPSRLRSDLSPGLDTVVLSCLAKDPAERTPDMAALARALLPFAPASMAACVASIERRSGALFTPLQSPLPIGNGGPGGDLSESQDGLSSRSRRAAIPGEKPGFLSRWPILAAAAGLAVVVTFMASRDPVASGASSSSNDVPANATSAATNPPVIESPSAASSAPSIAATHSAAPPVVFAQTATLPITSSPRTVPSSDVRPHLQPTATVIVEPEPQPTSQPPARPSVTAIASDPPASIAPSASASVSAEPAPMPAPSPIRTAPAPPILDATEPPDILH